MGYGQENEKRCAIAKTVHGYETRAAREYRTEKFDTKVITHKACLMRAMPGFRFIIEL